MFQDIDSTCSIMFQLFYSSPGVPAHPIVRKETAEDEPQPKRTWGGWLWAIELVSYL
jgi:hypothetical protein